MIVLTTTRTLRDLRDQIIALRLRHDDDIRSVLRLVPAEDAIRWSIDRARRALAESRDEPEAAALPPEVEARLVARADDPLDDSVRWWRPNPLLLMTSERGPDHEVAVGRYYAVIRNGVPMIQRSDTGGAVLHVYDQAADQTDTERHGLVVEPHPLPCCYSCEQPFGSPYLGCLNPSAHETRLGRALRTISEGVATFRVTPITKSVPVRAADPTPDKEKAQSDV